MLTTEGIIQLTPTSRLRVVRDETGSDSPLTWNDEVTTDSWEYRQWEAGEVYGVILEREKAYAKYPAHPKPGLDGGWQADFSKNPETWTEWEEAESIWGNYLTQGDEAEGISEYTAELVAASYFDLTPEEQDGLNLTPEEVYGHVVQTVRPVRPEAHAWLGRAEAKAGYVLDTRPGHNLERLPVRYVPTLRAYRRKSELQVVDLPRLD